MLKTQVQLLSAWCAVRDRATARMAAARKDERGEVTATTVIIVLLVIAAVTAGGIIASKIVANAEKVPSP